MVSSWLTKRDGETTAGCRGFRRRSVSVRAFRTPCRFLAVVLLGLCAAGIRTTGAGDPGTAFRDCAVCPEMVWLPAGVFIMGRNGGRAAEAPARLTRP